jgi:hypothetical protein
MLFVLELICIPRFLYGLVRVQDHKQNATADLCPRRLHSTGDTADRFRVTNAMIEAPLANGCGARHGPHVHTGAAAHVSPSTRKDRE